MQNVSFSKRAYFDSYFGAKPVNPARCEDFKPKTVLLDIAEKTGVYISMKLLQE